MKKVFSLVTALLVASSLTAFSGPGSTGNYSTKQFCYGIAFDKIVVDDDIDLVVYENATSNIQFDGSKEDIANIEWKVKKGVLHIKSKSGSLKNKVLVTLDVTQLSEIVINGNSNVRSLGNLNSTSLNVYIKSGCFVAIRNTGKINLINDEELEMDIKETTGNITFR